MVGCIFGIQTIFKSIISDLRPLGFRSQLPIRDLQSIHLRSVITLFQTGITQFKILPYNPVA
jgi:hypothetical protein